MSKENIKILIIAALTIIIIYLLYIHFKEPKNVVITDIHNLPTQTTNQLVVNDSTKGASQTVLITNDPATIKALQSQNQQLLTELAKVKPEYVLAYNEKLKQGEVIGTLKDSLSHTIDQLLAAQANKDISIDSFNRFKANILAHRIPFEITDNKWRFEEGSFDLAGNIQSDSLTILSKPFVTFGEKTGFLKRSTITVVVGNENPLMSQDSLKSYVFKPKTKTEFSFTPIFLSDGKSVTGAFGINIKKSILSLTLGYTLFNKTF